MNKIDEHTEARLLSLLRGGASVRQMAAKACVSRSTANTFCLRHRHEAPKCQHSKPIYECSSCCARRRSMSVTRDIIWLKPGPRKKEKVSEGMSAEQILKNGLMSALEGE